MCYFFTFDSDGMGKTYYFDKKLRKKIADGELSCHSDGQPYRPDSHTSIAEYYGYGGGLESKLNFYEYDPSNKKFTIDKLNTTDDSSICEKWVRKLDFRKIIYDPKRFVLKDPTKKETKLRSKDLSIILKKVKNAKEKSIESDRFTLRLAKIGIAGVPLGKRREEKLAELFGKKLSPKGCLKYLQIIDKLSRSSISFHNATKLHMTMLKYPVYKNGFFTPTVNACGQQPTKSYSYP